MIIFNVIIYEIKEDLGCAYDFEINSILLFIIDNLIIYYEILGF
jgi:hypothetical protein